MKLDEKSLNYVYYYHKDLFEIIQKKSLDYKINITNELVDKNQAEIENLNTHKKRIISCSPIGMLNKNKWTWNVSSKPNLENFINKSTLYNKVPNLKKMIQNMFLEKTISFNEKYKEFIPLVISDSFNNKFNVIRFYVQKDKYMYLLLKLEFIDKDKINNLITKPYKNLQDTVHTLLV